MLPNLQNLSTESIVFGGLTLIGLALVGLIYRIIKFYGNHTNSVIDKNTKAWIENTKSNIKLSNVIDRYHAKK